jgi:hypothetical protein
VYRKDLADLSKRYNFTLKTFPGRNRHLFRKERDAFLALRDQNSFVKYLGEFSYRESYETPGSSQKSPQDGGNDPLRNTHNIILEYGEADLEEFFLDKIPPVLSDEISSFWRELFAIADAIRNIHNLKVKENGRVQEYQG